MKIKIQYLLVVVFISSVALAQKKDENIGTEVVNVVKPYTPTISDAFKVKETPALEDEDNTKKEPIQYTIFSFPVASTFSPSKGRAAGVDKSKEERLFKNYITAGAGNYFNAFGELYLTQDIGDTDYAAAMIKHLSSSGGIKEVALDDRFINSSVDLTYGSKQKDYSWTTDLGYQFQRYYWYGLPADFGGALPYENRQALLSRMDPVQTYHNFNIGGRLQFTESVFDGLALKYDRFWDAYGSAENRFYVKPSFTFDAFQKSIKTEVIVDYVGGTFDKNYQGVTALKYGYTNLGIHPSFGMRKDDWSFDIGAAVYYSLNQNGSNKAYFYPKFLGSLKVVGDFMIFYVGLQGDLQQNSYRDFTNENPYVSPTLTITPTDKQYEALAGLKGKLSNEISYNLRASLINEKNKALFEAQDYSVATLDYNNLKNHYVYGNTFGVTYDAVRTFQLYGELKADFSKNLAAGIHGSFQKYQTKTALEAWNLPEINLGANLEVNITPRWYAGADVFYVGDRKDHQTNQDSYTLIPVDNIKTVKGYFDANAHVGFKYSARLTGFLRLNNLGNQAYQKWLNYPVQSFQVLVGANYKFDF